MAVAADCARIARSLGFPAPADVTGRRSVAALFPASRRRTGVYLLAFAEGSYYIGLARDVVRRFAEHRRTHGDRIVLLAFLPSRLRDLEVVERELIRRAERTGVPLEQTEWKTEVYGGCDLDDVFGEVDFARWQESPAHCFAQASWVAPQMEAGRHARDARRFSQLMSQPYGAHAVRLVARFARECVPGARQTAHDFWSVACVPSTNATTWPRLVCLSAHVMEVLVLGTKKGKPNSVWGFVVCARTPLEATYGGLPQAQSALGADEIEVSSYRSAGYDQCRIHFSSFPQAHAILDHPAACTAAGLLLYRVMRKGVTRYANHHCTMLADRLLADVILHDA